MANSISDLLLESGDKVLLEDGTFFIDLEESLIIKIVDDYSGAAFPNLDHEVTFKKIPPVGLLMVRVVNDTENATEIAIHRKAIRQILNEPLDLTEGVPRARDLVRLRNEFTGMGEELLRVVTWVKIITSDTGLTEGVIDQLNIPIVNESTGVTENIVKIMSFVRSINESTTMTESIVKRVPLATLVVDEAVQLTEATVIFEPLTEEIADDDVHITESVVMVFPFTLIDHAETVEISEQVRIVVMLAANAGAVPFAASREDIVVAGDWSTGIDLDSAYEDAVLPASLAATNIEASSEPATMSAEWDRDVPLDAERSDVALASRWDLNIELSASMDTKIPAKWDRDLELPASLAPVKLPAEWVGT